VNLHQKVVPDFPKQWGDAPVTLELAMLIPFEDRIIYDNLLASYQAHFGAGYRRSLNETHRCIQEREALITTLPPEEMHTPEKVLVSN
jgi:hypothetical protein